MSGPAGAEARPEQPGVLPRVVRFVPGVERVRTYQRAWLRADVQAGIVLTALLVPQGMAYGALAGLTPVAGIYATMVPLLVYAVLGPSRILIMAPDSAIAPVVAAAIIPLAGADVAARAGLAATLAVMVGILCIAGGLARLGFLTDLLSKPVRIGFLAGIAVVVSVDQLPTLLGIDVEPEGLIDAIVQVVRSIGETEVVTAIIGLGSVAGLLAIRRWWPRVPGALLAVMAGIGLVVAFGLQDQVATVGAVPQGLPAFSVPRLGAEEAGNLGLSALAIALVAFADTGVLSRSYATRLGDRVDQDQELLALGCANAATGLFQGFPISSSSSRTPAAEMAGAKTQLTGVVSAVGIGLVLVFATGLFVNLPTATLSAIVTVAVIGLFDLHGLRRLFRLNRQDFALSLTALLGVALIGVLQGIGVAVALSVGVLLWRAWHPYSAVLGRITGRKGYHDRERHPEGRQIPGLILFRFDAPLFFANAEHFREGVLDAVAQGDPPIHRVVVAAEPITDVDSTAADMLIELIEALRERGIDLAFAELKGPVKDKVEHYGLADGLAPQPFPSTVGEAVHAYLTEQNVPWTDWEDAEERESTDAR